MDPLSTDPPTVDNPVGRAMMITTAVTLPFPTIAVILRIWGRYRYQKPRASDAWSYGKQGFWVFWSDATILISYFSLLTLSVILFLGVKWGEGIHIKELTPYQQKQAVLSYFLYSVFYKWGAGISKMATCYLLLAISTPNMVLFNRVTLGLSLYVLAYSLACSIATVFQCGIDPRANWDRSLDQSGCFYKPPFWFAHGALNIIAIICTGALPWWLFSSITFQKKHFVAGLMTALVLGELIPSIVRLWGLYLSSQHLDDITYITTTGIFVSQLEVEFGVTAACVPTVLKILDEGYSRFLLAAFGIERSSHADVNGSGMESGSHQMSILGNTKNRAHGLYTRYENDDEADAGMRDDNSQEHIIARDVKEQSLSSSPSGADAAGAGALRLRDENAQIVVEKSYHISSARAVDSEELPLPVPLPKTRSHTTDIAGRSRRAT